MISPGVAGYYQEYFRGLSSSRDPAFKWATEWRELADRPADRPTAEAIVRGVIAERVGRLEAMIGELEEIAELEAEEAADRAAFDPGAGFERSARRQAALGRELLRTVEELRRLRKDATLAGIDSPAAHGQASCPCHPGLQREVASCGCGGGSPGEPTPQECRGLRLGRRRVRLRPSHAGRTTNPRRIARLSEHENATNEAKPESTQGTTGEEVTSSQGRHGDDERTQSARVGESGIAACEDVGWREKRKEVTTNLTNLTNRSDGDVTRRPRSFRATPGTASLNRFPDSSDS